jgi:hypothetical protein
LPACVATMVHVPDARKVACVPETVQVLVMVEAKLTARPEVAVAVSVRDVPTVCAPGLAKAIVCAVSGGAVTESVFNPVVLLKMSVLALSGV